MAISDRHPLFSSDEEMAAFLAALLGGYERIGGIIEKAHATLHPEDFAEVKQICLGQLEAEIEAAEAGMDPADVAHIKAETDRLWETIIMPLLEASEGKPH